MNLKSLSDIFNTIEETIKSPDIQIEFYKNIIKNLTPDSDVLDYIRYMVKERLKVYQTDPQFSFNSEGGYE